LHKVANRETDRQTNNDDYIFSLAEVKTNLEYAIVGVINV